MRPSLVPTVLACLGSCILIGTVFAAPVVLDAPELLPGLSGSSLINVDVIAGPSGAPNGFTIEWMTAALFTTLGEVWPADPALDSFVHSATFLGTPTLNTVDGTTTFVLGPGAIAAVQIGDIFDETGVFTDNAAELTSGTEYVFRVKANGDDGLGTGLLPASPYGATHNCWSKPHDDDQDCVHSQGYWKNHPSAWPLSSIRLGTIVYTKTQAIAVLMQPANGNGLVSLAHQLIAAKLNVATGASAGTLITGAISTSDALIGSKVSPPFGTGFLAPRITSHLADDLEEFNDDEMAHHDCKVVTAVTPRSWGQLKAMYR